MSKVTTNVPKGFRILLFIITLIVMVFIYIGIIVESVWRGLEETFSYGKYRFKSETRDFISTTKELFIDGTMTKSL